jgi:hypothetical protein
MPMFAYVRSCEWLGTCQKYAPGHPPFCLSFFLGDCPRPVDLQSTARRPSHMGKNALPGCETVLNLCSKRANRPSILPSGRLLVPGRNKVRA